MDTERLLKETPLLAYFDDDDDDIKDIIMLILVLGEWKLHWIFPLHQAFEY